MSRYKIESSRPSLPSDLEELLELFETEGEIHEFAKDLVRSHYEGKWEEVI
ncbi:hypothetical protein [Ammoniphilus sp. 3BR4]|uniref:hypothetical protein n=1 Tax=Ammoniphilus sp. 3BR4 TaxID=3158265 RepID=UPI003466B45C